MTSCIIVTSAIRTCEQGTKGCTVDHSPPCGEPGHVFCGACLAEQRERAGTRRVVIEWDGEWWTVSDEDSEFAKATQIEQALSYARELMHGPGTVSRSTAWQALHGKTERLR